MNKTYLISLGKYCAASAVFWIALILVNDQPITFKSFATTMAISVIFHGVFVWRKSI